MTSARVSSSMKHSIIITLHCKEGRKESEIHQVSNSIWEICPSRFSLFSDANHSSRVANA
jgi:hypothetical protein